MDWTKGYTSRWRVYRIDKRTWEPSDELGGVESAEIDRSCNDAVPMLETASMTVTRPALEEFEPGWYRIVMEATQGTSGESVALSTVWLEAQSGTYDKGYREDKLDGRSTLWQAADTPIGDGAYAPKGADGAAWAADALAAVIDAPVNVEGGFELTDHIVFDLGSSVLKAVWSVLGPYGWCLRIDGRGEVHVMAIPTKPALTLDRAGSCVLMPKTAWSASGITYTREYATDVYPYDVVDGMVPESGLDGLYRVKSQKLTCDKGVGIEETVEVIE